MSVKLEKDSDGIVTLILEMQGRSMNVLKKEHTKRIRPCVFQF